MSCGTRISARKQGDVVPEPNEFFSQVRYDSLSSSIQLRRNALPQGRNLGNPHWTLPFIMGLLAEPQGENFLIWSDIRFGQVVHSAEYSVQNIRPCRSSASAHCGRVNHHLNVASQLCPGSVTRPSRVSRVQ